MKSYIIPSNNLLGKEYVQKYVSNILEKYEQKVGVITPPICVDTLCNVIKELNEINIEIEPDKKISILDKGLLMPVQGGFIIKYGVADKDQKKFHNVKIRETICHELAHILFYDCAPEIPHLKIKPPEYLCHDIARQLLLPDCLVREKFSEKIRTNSDLIHIIQKLSGEFKVALMLIVKKLTEDLSLLDDTMVTFWKHESRKDSFLSKQIRYKDYRPDSKLSPGLRRLLPKYWRDLIYIEVWDKVVSKVAIGKTNDLPKCLYVEGKKRKKGRIKSIPFEIQCVSLYDRPNNLSFVWESNIRPALNILSVMKFNLDILQNGK